MPNIPPELVEEILQYLDGDTYEIRSCSLVSSSWTRVSQQYLFNTFSIDENDDPAKTCPKFLKLLGTSPHLASYVRSLKIIFGKPYPCVGKSKIEAVPRLTRLLSHFTNVKKLHIQAEYKEWANLPPKLVPSLRPLLPTLHSLIIEGPAFSEHGMELVHFLSHCTSQLSSLNLKNIQLVPIKLVGVQYPSVKAVLSGLDELRLHFDEYSSGSFEKGTIQTPNLRKYNRSSLASNVISPASSRFSFPFDGDNVQELTFDVGFGGGDSHPSDVPDLTALPKLRHIDFTLHTQGNDGETLFESYLRDTFAAMDSRTLRKLETIKTKIELPWSWRPLGEQTWKRIGRALRALVNAGTFRYAVFEFFGRKDDPSEATRAAKELIESARNACGGLIECGVMVIEPHIKVDDALVICG
ncbi:hypothetical protein ONZ45_g10520 [Pleurotus djamor]|nr:hypothetical protein ONZ45_g10520 [Pleurotus djamor]